MGTVKKTETKSLPSVTHLVGNRAKICNPVCLMPEPVMLTTLEYSICSESVSVSLMGMQERVITNFGKGVWKDAVAQIDGKSVNFLISLRVVYGKIIFPCVICLQITCLALTWLLSHNLFISIHQKISIFVQERIWKWLEKEWAF